MNESESFQRKTKFQSMFLAQEEKQVEVVPRLGYDLGLSLEAFGTSS